MNSTRLVGSACTPQMTNVGYIYVTSVICGWSAVICGV